MEAMSLVEGEVREARKEGSLGRRDLIFSEIKDISSIFSALQGSKKSKLKSQVGCMRQMNYEKIFIWTQGPLNMLNTFFEFMNLTHVTYNFYEMWASLMLLAFKKPAEVFNLLPSILVKSLMFTQKCSISIRISLQVRQNGFKYLFLGINNFLLGLANSIESIQNNSFTELRG